MFKALHLGNFKAFSSSQEVTLKPLTIVFGPNSAGKSSLIHGLLFAHEAVTNDGPDNLDVRRPRIGGDAVDLGGFKQFIHRRNSENRMEWGVTILTHKLSERMRELLRPVEIITVTAQIGIAANPNRDHVLLQSFEISTDSGLLLRGSMKRRADSFRLSLDELETSNPAFMQSVENLVLANTWSEQLNTDDLEIVINAVDELVPLMELKPGNFLPRGVQKPQTDGKKDTDNLQLNTTGLTRPEELAKITSLMVPRLLDEIVAGITNYIESTIRKMRYLGPLRSYPSRHLAFSQEYDTNWDAGGGYAWDRVRLDPDVREKVNKWLGSPGRMRTPYQLIVRDLYSTDDLEDPLWQSLEELEEKGLETAADPVQADEPDIITKIADIDTEIKRFQNKLRTSGIEPIKDLALIDINRKTIVSHRDVGIGISQVLPVLVSAYASHDELLAMEQPELHLHPALQAELADVFIDSAIKQKNTIILETHSEHLILRLLRRVRETAEVKSAPYPLRPHDISILVLNQVDGETTITEIPIDEDGEFKMPWPDGFFPERAQELF